MCFKLFPVSVFQYSLLDIFSFFMYLFLVAACWLFISYTSIYKHLWFWNSISRIPSWLGTFYAAKDDLDPPTSTLVIQRL